MDSTNGYACLKALPALLPAWFVSVMQLVTDGFYSIRMYLDDAIGSDDSLMAHVTTLATFFARLRLHKLKISPNKTRIGAARVDFLGHVTFQDGVRPNDDKISALAQMPMPWDIKQLRSLLGGLSYNCKFLPNMPRRVRSITSLLKKRATFDFTPPGSGRPRPTRGTRSPTDTCLSRLGRCYRQVSTIPPALPCQHRRSRSNTRAGAD